MPRVKISTTVDEHLWSKFKEVAQRLYGRYGGISRAIEEAIKMWLLSRGVSLEPPGDTAIQTRSKVETQLNKIARIVNTYFDVKKMVKILLGMREDEELVEAPAKVVREAIKRVLNVVDERTVNNWLERFRNNGLIYCRAGEPNWRYCKVIAFLE